MSARSRVRVVVADDSAISRKVLGDLVESSEEMELVASVKDGQDAVREVKNLSPDVLLMDVLMPGVDGLSATAILMRESPLPIVLVSELVGRDADINFRALEVGALDVLRKPASDELAGTAKGARFLRKIQAYSRVPVVRRHGRAAPAAHDAGGDDAGSTAARSTTLGEPGGELSMICIGASTGGPPAIRRIVAAVDGVLEVPMLICQHMTEGFMAGMSRWLNDEASNLRVSIAEDGERLVSGHVYLAPDNAHLRCEADRLRVSPGPDGARHRPCIDFMFESVADSVQCSSVIAMLLTGMGDDGANGLLRIRRAGGVTIAQDEGSSVVFGMPKVAQSLGAASQVLSLEDIARRTRAECIARRAVSVRG
ncbi:MAG: chemotaxis-specific protein-glutamate methyltransferase CheB [Gammaproteobacteria bacterium]|nr:chemotaxis-specific protein-glutamate methyltransferase CheB [Gammaproteobacteria bacterium]